MGNAGPLYIRKSGDRGRGGREDPGEVVAGGFLYIGMRAGNAGPGGDSGRPVAGDSGRDPGKNPAFFMHFVHVGRVTL